MQDQWLSQATEYIKKDHQKRRWKKVLSFAMCVVVFVTTYALILPALTAEGQTFCGVEAHEHTEACYRIIEAETAKELLCEEIEAEPHTHSESCYEKVAVGTESILKTELNPEGDSGFSTEVSDSEQGSEYAADIEEDLEIKPEVPETEIVVIYEEKLVCERVEVTGHIHTDSCYHITEISSESKELMCEKDIHVHDLACYSDSEADLENEAVWTKTFEDVELTDKWPENVLAIAESQLGYKESTRNYQVMNDGESMKGYTRYGAWYGVPYGDWCAMFASFCIHYAGVEDYPLDSSCSSWIEKLSDESLDLYHDEADYIPEPGDLVFFDWEVNGDPDHVGIVVEILPETELEKASVKVIEGNSNEQVQYVTYVLDDETIYGYGELPNEKMMLFDMSNSNDIMLLDSNDPENGDLYHVPYNNSSGKYTYYQWSSHLLDGGQNVCFMLVPASQYTKNWKPSTTEWSANANANYVVAYCSDSQTYSTNDGANYTTFVLDKSRFTDEDQKRTLKGIVANAYPFLTVTEMKKKLNEAYDNGEISIDVGDCCTQAEMITAAQWAIWDTTTLQKQFSTVSGYTAHDDTSCLNPIQSVGHKDNKMQTHVKAIRDWLIAQKVSEDLEVMNHSVDIRDDGNGTYRLTVDITMNRPVEADEDVETQLLIGDKEGELTAVGEGAATFRLSMEGVTESELTQANVYLMVSGNHIQAYFYDSENYQDMIGGKWESFAMNLSFDVGTESTDVSVTKHWADGKAGANAVQVQLFADGIAKGNKVTLSAANDWSYVWEDLIKKDIYGNEIEYTVEEDEVNGYYTNITKVKGADQTVSVWEKATKFEDGKSYVLLTRNGALKSHVFKNNNRLTYAPADLSTTETTPANVIWKASNIASSGTGAVLQNTGVSNKNKLKLSSSRFDMDSSGSTVYYSNGKIYISNGYRTYYFTGINSDGYGETITSASGGSAVDLYVKTEKQLPASEMNYIITNTKIPSDAQYMTMAMKKEWQGKRGGDYPDYAKVTLMQNGESYGPSVLLNESNNWSCRWDNLLVEINGEKFDYTIVEEPMEGYTASVNEALEGSGYTHILTNTWESQYVSLTLSKVDADDSSEYLNGAEFKIYCADALEGEFVEEIEGTDGEMGVWLDTVTAVNGKVVFDRFEVGASYYLVETKAPDGYAQLKAPIKFYVGERDGQIVVDILSGMEWAEYTNDTEPTLKIMNEEYFELPETGGLGTYVYYIGGLLLVGGAVCIFCKNKKIKG